MGRGNKIKTVNTVKQKEMKRLRISLYATSMREKEYPLHR